jgi:hypothetical protein
MSGQEPAGQSVPFDTSVPHIARVYDYWLGWWPRRASGSSWIGTGLPAASNTHEVAQRAAPESRVVYVDNDHCKSGCAHAC